MIIYNKLDLCNYLGLTESQYKYYKRKEGFKQPKNFGSKFNPEYHVTYQYYQYFKKFEKEWKANHLKNRKSDNTGSDYILFLEKTMKENE